MRPPEDAAFRLRIGLWICIDLHVHYQSCFRHVVQYHHLRLEDGKRFHLCKPISCNLTILDLNCFRASFMWTLFIFFNWLNLIVLTVNRLILTRLFRADGLHPSRVGEELLSDNITRTLRSIWLISQFSNNCYDDFCSIHLNNRSTYSVQSIQTVSALKKIFNPKS